jgi:Ca2+-dependent lipid-binding protein
MDMLGSVDPYALVAFQGNEYRTKTVKASYTPEWNEVFQWDVAAVEKGCRTDFIVQLNDWDAASKDDEVGSFTIPASRMSEIVRARIGWFGTDNFPLYLDGKLVIGHDREPSEVTVRVRVEEVPKAFAVLEVDPEAKGQRMIQVTVMRADHLPKVRTPLSALATDGVSVHYDHGY